MQTHLKMGKEIDMKIAMVYFSATGNTARVGSEIAKVFTDKGVEVENFDVTSLSSRQKAIDFAAFDAAVFGAPIHSCRAPRIFREWMTTLNGEGKKAAMFFTYGGFGVHPTHYSTREILENQGFKVVSSAEFLGAHTFNKGGWQAVEGRPNEQDFEVAREFAAKTHARFTGEDSGALGELEKTDMTEEFLDSIEGMRFKVLTQSPSRNGEDCSMCMACEDECPSGAMDAEKGEADMSKCIACLRCVDVCPEDALKINDMTAIFSKKMESSNATVEDLQKKQSKIYL